MRDRMEVLVSYILLVGVLISAALLAGGMLAHSPGLLKAGILVLLFTPYLRVVASVLYFAFAERNLKYTVFTGFVLTVLTYSLFLR